MGEPKGSGLRFSVLAGTNARLTKYAHSRPKLKIVTPTPEAPEDLDG
jgi:hypothetical protein